MRRDNAASSISRDPSTQFAHLQQLQDEGALHEYLESLSEDELVDVGRDLGEDLLRLSRDMGQEVKGLNDLEEALFEMKELEKSDDQFEMKFDDKMFERYFRDILRAIQSSLFEHSNLC